MHLVASSRSFDLSTAAHGWRKHGFASLSDDEHVPDPLEERESVLTSNRDSLRQDICQMGPAGEIFASFGRQNVLRLRHRKVPTST